MLKLSHSQSSTLRDLQLQRFEDDLVSHLRDRFAGVLASMDDNQVRSVVRHGWARAQAYGVVSEYDIRRFLEFVCQFRGKFEQQPWAEAILNDRGLSGDQKMDRIDAVATYSIRQSE